MKPCGRCGETKPESEFYKNSKGKPGSRCKECHSAAARDWQRKNPERVAISKARHRPKARVTGRAYYHRNKDRLRSANVARARAWRAANRERHRAYSKAWARENPERYRQAQAEHYAANKDQRRQRAREWREKNRERHRESSRRDARRRYLNRDGAAYEYGEILRADPCSYCGGSAGWVDHVIPLSGGGPNVWDNLTAACGSCNARKRSLPLLTFLGRLCEAR